MEHCKLTPEGVRWREECNVANRLRFEKSPYLLQHANNPVDWYSWEKRPGTRSRGG
jgi:hypothetical protein